MAKTQRNKRQRLEVKKKIRDAEICPHCSRRVQNLEEHIRRLHGLRCDTCGKTFAQRQQWVNHMRDLHQLTERAADRDEKVCKIVAWLDSRRKAGKSGRTLNRALTTPLAGSVAMGNGGAECMEADGDAEAAAPLQPPRCAECGAAGPPEAAVLARQGLAFRCELVGRRCAAPAPEARAVAAPMPNFAAPTPVAAPMPTFAAPTQGGPPVFCAGMPAAFFPQVPATAMAGFAQELAAAANIPIGDDDDDDL
mmetsp:Transcript_96750/g.268973  ORF Transcript_96750/g.268973 Transcript_96750/m.268973 type:complete len:251 (+) Transcript_96750:126-878(+)